MTTRKITCAFLMVFALLLASPRLALAWPDQPPDKALISGAPVLVSLLAAIGGVLLITWLVQSRTKRTRVAESAAD